MGPPLLQGSVTQLIACGIGRLGAVERSPRAARPNRRSTGFACGLDAGARIKRWRETLPNGASCLTYDCIDGGYLDNTSVFTVPAGHFFALGDNRDNSTDSRMMSAMGFIPMDNLVGRVTWIFWSQDDSGELRPERLGKIQ